VVPGSLSQTSGPSNKAYLDSSCQEAIVSP
jgi:hypothetical protein